LHKQAPTYFDRYRLLEQSEKQKKEKALKKGDLKEEPLKPFILPNNKPKPKRDFMFIFK
jgi:hypothetical protein